MEKMLWTGCAMALAAALVACGDDTNDAGVEPAAGEDMVGTADSAVPADTDVMAGVTSGTYPVVEASGTENGVMAIPSAFRGKWAANANACDGGWWRFDEMKTETVKGVTCDLTGIEPNAGGISTTLVLTCNGEGMTANERWEVSQPQGGQLMLLRQFDPASGGGTDGNGVLPLVECPATAADAAKVPSTYWARG